MMSSSSESITGSCSHHDGTTVTPDGQQDRSVRGERPEVTSPHALALTRSLMTRSLRTGSLRTGSLRTGSRVHGRGGPGGFAHGVGKREQIILRGASVDAQGEPDDLPPAGRRQPLGMLVTEVVGVRFGIGGQRTEHRRLIGVYIGERGHRAPLARGPRTAPGTTHVGEVTARAGSQRLGSLGWSQRTRREADRHRVVGFGIGTGGVFAAPA
jgi:hypothetical protein